MNTYKAMLLEAGYSGEQIREFLAWHQANRWAVELWTNPNDLVLSPFAGIGSEGFVALNMGRKFIGYELKESYFKQACSNLATAGRANMPLFANLIQKEQEAVC